MIDQASVCLSVMVLMTAVAIFRSVENRWHSMSPRRQTHIAATENHKPSCRNKGHSVQIEPILNNRGYVTNI